jgi:restriction system protein
MKNYYRVMLGKGSAHAPECLSGGFIGADFGIHQDLGRSLPDDWKEFNREFIPVYQRAYPDKTKIGAGLACGALWTVAKGIAIGDIVLCPDGTGKYRVGEVTGEYRYAPGEVLFHRRPVTWLPVAIDRADLSDALRHSAGSIGTVSNISRHREEIDRLIGGASNPTVISTDPSIEDPTAFALEEQLEDFLISNWEYTLLGKEYDIYEEAGERAQQYKTDTGRLDILAISKDRRKLLVVELKKGRASDAVVGQTLRYMSFVKDELADGREVLGAIIAQEDDIRLRRAIALIPAISFYRYQVTFKLMKV